MTESNQGPSSLFASKSQKGRRKISLPWFRNNSVNPPHPALSRQHTIDSPASFRFPNSKQQQQYQVGQLTRMLKNKTLAYGWKPHPCGTGGSGDGPCELGGVILLLGAVKGRLGFNPLSNRLLIESLYRILCF